MRLYRNWLLGHVCLRAVASAPCLAKPLPHSLFEFYSHADQDTKGS